MTVELEQRGRDSARALSVLVDDVIDTATLDLALESVLGGLSRTVPTHRSHGSRRVRLAVVLAAAAALLVGLIVIARQDHEKVPVTPVPSPTTTGDSTTSTTGAPTTTVVPQPDRASTDLASVGPELGFGPYPPVVVLLPDGRILKIAGSFGDPNTLDVLDPSSGKVTTLGTTLVGRSRPVMVVLRDGRLLVAGEDMTPPVSDGNGGTSSTSADVSTGEVVDLRTGRSVSVGPMITKGFGPMGALLPDGRVLIVGSTVAPDVPVESFVAELFDPTTNSFRPTGRRTTNERPIAILPMSDGRTLVFGTHPEIYDPSSETFVAAGDETLAQRAAAAVMLPDGTVLAIETPGGACGEDHTIGADGFSEGHRPVPTERFDPSTGTFTPGPELPHCVLTAAALPSGQVFVAGQWWVGQPPPTSTTYGGLTPSGDSMRTWSGVLDPRTGATTITPNPNRYESGVVVTPDGRLFLVGGAGVGNGTLTWADAYP